MNNVKNIIIVKAICNSTDCKISMLTWVLSQQHMSFSSKSTINVPRFTVDVVTITKGMVYYYYVTIYMCNSISI